MTAYNFLKVPNTGFTTPGGQSFSNPSTQDTGFNLPKGWKTDSFGNFGTPEGWWISKDQKTFTSPKGDIYTADQIKQNQQLQSDIGNLFPQDNYDELANWANTDPQKFVDEFQKIGATPTSISVLKRLGLNDQQVQQIYPQEGPPIPQGYEVNDQGKMIQTGPTTDQGGFGQGLAELAQFKNPYRQGGAWEADQAMQGVDIQNPLSVAAATVPMELMGGNAIPKAVIAAAANVLGPAWQTAMGFAGADTSGAIAPDYIGKIFSAISDKLGGQSKAVEQIIQAGLDRGSTTEDIGRELSMVPGLKQETIDQLASKIPEAAQIKLSGAVEAGIAPATAAERGAVGEVPGAVPVVAKAVENPGVETPILDKLHAAAPASSKTPTTIRDIWNKATLGIQSIFTDYARTNRIAGQTMVEGVKGLEKSPLESKLALLGGVTTRAQQLVRDTLDKVQSALGNIPAQYVDDYLKLIHNQDILNAHPDRAVTGGINGIPELQQGLREIVSKLGPDGYAKVVQASQFVIDHWKSELADMVDSGLVSRETADALNQMYPHYNPTKYLDMLLKEGPGGKGASVSANDLKLLSESGSEAKTVSPLSALLNNTIKKELLIQRNDAARSIAEMVPNSEEIQQELSKLPKSQVGSISCMENGQKVEVAVPKWLEKEVALTNQYGGDAAKIFRLASKINLPSRLGMTGLNVAFQLPMFITNSITAMMDSGIGPLDLGRALLHSFNGILENDPVLRRFNLAGAGSNFRYFGSEKSEAELLKEAEKGGNIVLRQMSDWKRLLNPVNALSEFGQALFTAPRLAIFEKSLAGGATEEAAAVAARRNIADYSRGNAFAKLLGQAFLYLNPGLQHFAQPFRMLANNPASRWRMAGLLAFSAGVYEYNQSYPEYADVPDYFKYGTQVIMLPSDQYDKNGNKVPHYLCIPIRQFALFTGPLQYALAALQKKDPGNFQKFFGTWFSTVNPTNSIAGESGISAPPLIKTFNDIKTNHDSYRNQPIVPDNMKDLPPSQQYDQYDSDTAVKIGQMLNISPKLIDYAITNVLGGVGAQATTIIDKAIQALDQEQPDFRIQRLTAQLKAIQDDVPASMKGATDQQIGQEINRQRTAFLDTLSPDDRVAILKAEKEPEPTIPILSTIINRIYKTQGGQETQNAAADIEQQKTATPTPAPLDTEAQTYTQAINDFNAGKITIDALESARKRYLSYRSGYLADQGTQYKYPTQSEIRTKLGTEPPEQAALSDYFTTLDELANKNSVALGNTGAGDLYKKLQSEAIKSVVDTYGEQFPGLADYITQHRLDYLNNLPPDIATFEKFRQSELEQGTWYARARKEGVGMQEQTPPDIAALYQEYNNLASTKEKTAFRYQHPDLNNWMTSMGYAALKTVTPKKLTAKKPTWRQQLANMHLQTHATTKTKRRHYNFLSTSSIRR